MIRAFRKRRHDRHTTIGIFVSQVGQELIHPITNSRYLPGDEIAIRVPSHDLDIVAASLQSRTRPSLMEWLALDEKSQVGRMVRRPERQDIPLAVQEQLIVELYSK